jgi:myo-inositol-1(or 4)-monophosphatase
MSDLRAFAIELAESAGRLAQAHAPSVDRATVQAKRDRDYVSHVDQLVEREIVARIRARHPDHAILGEESGASAGAGGAPLWVIDPIDGTTNFIHGLPQWSVSIALCLAGAPQVAVVRDPCKGETFSAERGQGAWLDGRPLKASGCAALRQALVATAMPFRFSEIHAEALRVFGAVQAACDDQRRGGSAALDLAWVAAGRLDAYYELGIYPWDVAAGELLVREAGGTACDYAGRSEGLLQRRSVVAAATPAVERELLALVAPLQPWLARPPFARA